jgi:hypothetical protein
MRKVRSEPKTKIKPWNAKKPWILREFVELPDSMVTVAAGDVCVIADYYGFSVRRSPAGIRLLETIVGECPRAWLLMIRIPHRLGV